MPLLGLLCLTRFCSGAPVPSLGTVCYAGCEAEETNGPRTLLRRLQGHRLSLRPGSALRLGTSLCNAMLHSRSTSAWLAFLCEFERQHALPLARAEIASKPFSNYAAAGLPTGERVRMLKTHYSLAAATFDPSVFNELWRGNTVAVGHLTGKSQKRYRLAITPSHHHEKEGEFSFCLSDAEDGFELASLTFVLADPLPGPSKRALFIGGLQGPSSFYRVNQKARIIAATRDLRGLRPKMAVFIAASALAASIGTESLLGVSNGFHTINADAWYQRRRLRASYDAFWLERGGRSSRFGFEIPIHRADPRAQRRSDDPRAVAAALGRGLIENRGS